jgi:hypothetical protein
VLPTLSHFAPSQLILLQAQTSTDPTILFFLNKFQIPPPPQKKKKNIDDQHLQCDTPLSEASVSVVCVTTDGHFPNKSETALQRKGGGYLCHSPTMVVHPSHEARKGYFVSVC